jgi:hypothetical protein
VDVVKLFKTGANVKRVRPYIELNEPAWLALFDELCEAAESSE